MKTIRTNLHTQENTSLNGMQNKKNNGNTYRKNTIKITAYNLSDGHYDVNGKLLFNGYDTNEKPVIKKKGEIKHTAILDSFLVVNNKDKYFCEENIFLESYSLNSCSKRLQENNQNISKKNNYNKINISREWNSKPIEKKAYDLLEGHLGSNSKLLFDMYNEDGLPIVKTLENTDGNVGNLDDFIIIGIEGEKHFCSRNKFLELYKPIYESIAKSNNTVYENR